MFITILCACYTKDLTICSESVLSFSVEYCRVEKSYWALSGIFDVRNHLSQLSQNSAIFGISQRRINCLSAILLYWFFSLVVFTDVIYIHRKGQPLYR